MKLARLENALSLLGSAGGPDTVLSAFVRYSSEEAGAQAATLFLLDDDCDSLLPTVSIDIAAHWSTARTALRVGMGAPGAAVAQRAPVVFANMADAVAGSRERRLADESGAQSLSATPLYSSAGAVLGVIEHLFADPRPPNDEQLRIGAVYSRLVAAVIERAKLREDEAVREAFAAQRRAERVADAGALLASSIDYATTLQNIASVFVACVADSCVVSTSIDGGALLNAAVAHRDGAEEEEMRGLLGLEATQAESWLQPHRRLDAAAPASLFEPRGERFMVHLLLPLRVGVRRLGAVCLGAKSFSADDRALAAALAERAAFALGHANAHRVATHALGTRDELLAIVAHDLQNLILTASMAATLLRRTSGDPRPAKRDHLRHIEHATERMKSLVRDLLDGASIESGRFSIDRRRCSLAAVLRDAFQTMEPLAEQRGLRLECDYPADELEVLCDPMRIAQVFSNLVGNAIKFTPEGTIRVRAETRDGSARIEVTDEGVGIEPAQIDRVFDRFWFARANSVKSTGLGLYIAKTIVEAHGGRIWAESEGAGKGATVAFTVPLAVDASTLA